MMRLVLVAGAGLAAAWLSRSEQAREELRRRLSAGSASLQQATKTAASAAVSRAGQADELVAKMPLPRALKDTVTRATTTVREATAKAGGARTATLYVQESPDGS